MTGKPPTPDASVESIYRVLLVEAQKQQLIPQRFAKRADLPYASAHKILSGSAKQPTLSSMMALAETLGWTLEVRDKTGKRLA